MHLQSCALCSRPPAPPYALPNLARWFQQLYCYSWSMIRRPIVQRMEQNILIDRPWLQVAPKICTYHILMLWTGRGQHHVVNKIFNPSCCNGPQFSFATPMLRSYTVPVLITSVPCRINFSLTFCIVCSFVTMHAWGVPWDVTMCNNPIWELELNLSTCKVVKVYFYTL